MYLTLKTLHLIFLFAWFAGLFYLPRLFVYQGHYPQNSVMLGIMQKKLYFFIMLPAMLGSLIFGLWLFIKFPHYMQFGWMHAKLTLVFLLLIYHHICGYFVRKSLAGKALPSSRFFRLFNEVPTILLILIVVLVVIKPF